MDQAVCLRCRFTWRPRIPGRPARCPDCGHRRWDQPPRERPAYECLHDGCGHRWQGLPGGLPPARCPRCARTKWNVAPAEARTVTCRQCDPPYSWLPRVADPVECPKCHSYRWREPPRPNDPLPLEPVLLDESCRAVTYAEAPWPPPARLRHGHGIVDFLTGVVKPGPQPDGFCITDRCELHRVQGNPP